MNRDFFIQRFAILVVFTSLLGFGWAIDAAADDFDGRPEDTDLEPGDPTDTDPAPPPADLDDGREPDAEPGDPTDTDPAPPPADLDDGREPDAEPGDPTGDGESDDPGTTDVEDEVTGDEDPVVVWDVALPAEPDEPDPDPFDDGRETDHPVVEGLEPAPDGSADTIDPRFGDQDPCALDTDGCRLPCWHCPGPDGTDDPPTDRDGEGGTEAAGLTRAPDRARATPPAQAGANRPAAASGAAQSSLPWWTTLDRDIRHWITW